MGDDKIIVVANIKGGVGKTTVAIAYANYLVLEKKIPIGGVIDCDPQASARTVRDLNRLEAKETPLAPLYDVVPFSLANDDGVPDLVEKLRESGRTWVFDTPGNVGGLGMVYLLSDADVIIVPFSFDSMALDSTLQFLRFWNNIKARIEAQGGEPVGTKVFLVPNDIDNRFGTIKDKVRWRDFERRLREVAVVTDQIRHTKNMTKVSTLGWMDNQKDLVIKAFLCIDHGIQGTPLYEPKENDSETSTPENDTENGMEESAGR